MSNDWMFDGKRASPITPGEFNIFTVNVSGVPAVMDVDFPIAYVLNIGPFGRQRYVDVWAAYQAAAIVLPYTFHVTIAVGYPGGNLTQSTGSSFSGLLSFNHFYPAIVPAGNIVTITINADGTYTTSFA